MQIVCRDRAGAYAEGIRAGAPDAVQVADRWHLWHLWHLWHNLVHAVEKVVRQHHADLRAPASCTGPTGDTAATHDDTNDERAHVAGLTRLAVRTSERFTAEHDILGAGSTVSAISETLGLDPKTRATLLSRRLGQRTPPCPFRAGQRA